MKITKQKQILLNTTENLFDTLTNISFIEGVSRTNLINNLLQEAIENKYGISCRPKINNVKEEIEKLKNREIR